jgi:hypothetical protein
VVPRGRDSTCSPVIETATTTQFVLKNPLKGGNFLQGELDSNGRLEFVIENLPKDGTGCPGWWMFEQMISHFGSAVAVVVGYWEYGDNLDMVNRLTAIGTMSIEAAACQGPTGQYALAHGFVNVQVVQAIGNPGAYSRVVVWFTK